MHLSVREVLDLTERCFIAAGFDAGPARANAETLWWQEAYRGTGFTTLFDLLDELETFDRSRLSLDRCDEIAVIDSGSQPGIVSVNPAVDLCCSLASQNGLGVVYAPLRDEDSTLSSLGHQSFRAGERGYISLTSYADQTSSGTVVGLPDDPYPHIVEAELTSRSESYARLVDFVSSTHSGAGHSSLVRALCKGSTGDRLPAEKHVIARLLEGAVTPVEPEHEVTGLVTICVDPTHQRYAGGCRGVVESFVEGTDRGFTRRFRPEDIRNRVETLLENGIEVEASVWRDVFDYSSGVLAPEFEGSYRGAGFDINE